jgi:RNA polymerase sigma factor (sigma-70 family)
MPLPENREALVIGHIWLVKSIARKICNIFDCSEIFEDLKQEGTIGLIRAVERYDPEAGVQLSTYAYRWIRGGMLNYLNRNSKYGIKISRLLRDQARKIVCVHDDLMQEFSRKPTIEEVSKASGLPIKEVEEGLDLLAMSLADLNDPSENGNESFEPTNQVLSPEESTIRRGQIEAVLAASRQLAPDRSRALMLRYCEDLSNRETAEKMGKTEGAVKVLVHRALEDLRKIFGPGPARENPPRSTDNRNDGGNTDVGI